MTSRKQTAINEMIRQAIREEINAVGFAIPDLIPHLKRVQAELCDAGKRITYDIGRSRRLIQLCKQKRVK